MFTRFLFAAVLAVGCITPAHAIDVWFSQAPGSVQSGSAYYIEVSGSAGGNCDLTLWKNGNYLTSAGGWGSASAGLNQTDYGAQTVEYFAEAYDNYYSEYNSTYAWVTITQPNNAPTISWSQNPDWVPIGQNYYVQVRGQDQDGNLFGVSVWKNGAPYALNGGQNTADMYSDVNWLSESTPQQIVFSAQAYDNSGAESAIIYHTVNIYDPNQAPTIGWIGSAPSPVYVNQYYTVQARGFDANGNLASVFVWKDDQPYAFNGGGNGYQNDSDANVTLNAYPGTVTFKARAADTANAESGFIYRQIEILNRSPYGATISGSGSGVGWNATGGHYTLWLNGSITINAAISDLDGNLTGHTIYYQKVTGSSPSPSGWTAIDNDHAPSNATNSTKTKTFTPNSVGRWDFHTNGTDGYASPAGASFTVWVYGSTNGASFVSQSVPATMTTGDSFQVTVVMSNANGSDRPWETDASPHKLKSIAGSWTPAAVALPGNATVNPAPQANNTATFTFNVTAPTQPGSQPFQWRMVEDFPGNPVLFGAASTLLNINVVDNDPPTAATNLNATNVGATSFRLNWTAATDNGPVINYEVFRTLNGNTVSVGTTANTWIDVTGLASGVTYSLMVRARDGVTPTPLTANSASINVTTAFDPEADNDGDGVKNGLELELGLDPNNATDTRVHTFTYDKVNQLKKGPGGEYTKDAEGNIKTVSP